MKTKFRIALSILFTALFVAGCATNSTGIGDAKTASYNHFNKTLTQKNVHALIKKIAQKNGWRVTEFKDSQIIAEKTQDDNSIAVSIHFASDYFYLVPQNSELQTLISKELNE